jgi:hypothetical protein
MKGLLLAAFALALAACGEPERPAEPAAAARGVDAVDDARLLAAASEPESWLTYGGS